MALDRVRRPPHKSRYEEYPELADKAVEGEVYGSSAGGEQAKFATYSKERDAHVIVKFSPKGNGELATRWKDILVTEYIASETLHNHDIPAAKLKIFENGDRIFLESVRFDRTGEHGRLPLISMQAIDNEFSGVGSGWLPVAKELHRQGLITWQHLSDIAVYWGFGKLINNTDMHLGNISFSIDETGFNLAPAYDMCSMGFSPKSTGEIPPFAFSEPDIDRHLELVNPKTGDMIRKMAHDFWTNLSESKLISGEFREYILQSDLLKPLPDGD
ncbi:MAG: HipA domain-containing protein [Desulfobulbaceae bacterium]|nr:HipA domain-containing protein [Desulfobulbaceae bacterium]